MKRYILSSPLRVVLLPALALLISSGAASYALTGSIVPSSSAGVEVVVDTSPPRAHVDVDVRTSEPPDKPEVDRDNREVHSDDAAKPASQPRSTQGCPPGFTGNHGDFVSHTDRPRDEAARSDCGKPQHPNNDHGTVERQDPGHAESHEFDDEGGEEHGDGHGNPSTHQHEQDGNDDHDGGPDD